MEEKLLTKVRQNEIFDSIQHLGLDPAEFRWVKTEPNSTRGYLVSKLVHLPTQFFFTFALSRDYFWCEWWPADDFEARHNCLVKSWSEQKEVARNWLIAVRAELTAPDLWEAALADRILFSETTNETNNDRFTAAQLEAIDQKLDEISAYIQKNHTRDEKAEELVARRIDYLKEAARRLGQIDWLNIVVGQLLALAVEGAISSTALSDIMRFAGLALHSILTFASRLLQ